MKILKSAAILALLLTPAWGRAGEWCDIDTRLGTQAAQTRTAGRFGKHTEEQGHCLPAVLTPHGMTFWTPQTRDTEQKGVCPYYSSDTKLQGFRASHWIVGGCTQDYGSFTLMPLTQNKRLKPVERAEEYRDEVALPYYYKVCTPGVKSEMTATARAAIFRFTFDSKKKAYLAFNVNSDEGQGDVHFDGELLRLMASNPVYRIYQGWGEEAGMTGYFAAEFRLQDVADWGMKDGVLWIRFRQEKVLVRCATSFTGIAGAFNNLQAELPHWDFERAKSLLKTRWEQEFNKIQLGSLNDENTSAARQLRVAQYHAAFLPHDISDVDGSYPAFAGNGIRQPHNPTTLKPHNPKPTQPYYDDFSAWDTYRALHPWLCISSPTVAGHMMQSLIDKYETAGWLPIFPCWNSYTAAMIGDHCAAILAEAAVKGILFDHQKAYEAMLKNATQQPLCQEEYADGKGRRALESYLKYGYIPVEDTVPYAFHHREQTSRTLEYAYDDYCVAQMARLVGDREHYPSLTARSRNWANVFDPETRWINGRRADGNWLGDAGNESKTFENFREFSKPIESQSKNFDAFHEDFSTRPSHITEGWTCHYSWYVPHDVPGLIRMMGGRERFVSRLDSLFEQRLYWHGNEPCHQIAYLYNYAGEPWKTQKWVRFILDTEYALLPGGLSGNDDAGQLSAWYIFSSLGFYPVCPVSGEYAIGSPVFPEVHLSLENGKTFTILAHDASKRNIYVQRAELNGKPLERMFFTHDDLLAGGILELWMGDSPSSLTPDPSPKERGVECATLEVTPLDFGAKGDGVTDDTEAVQRAIDACASHIASLRDSTSHSPLLGRGVGGEAAVLTFPAGHTFLCGPLQLRGNIDYHFEATSKLLADPREETYTLSAFGDNRGEGMLWLWANGEENITISGQGILDGNGIAFMGPELEDSYVLKELKDPKFDPRPHLLTLFGCRNTEISGVTIQNGAYWTVHLVGCDGAKIHDMSLLNQLKIRNGDGIDLDHTRNVDIWNCHIESGDDCICLKNRREYSPGYKEAFTYLGRPEGLVMLSQQCRDIRAWNCVMTGRSCTIKIGSENMDSIQNVLFDRCIIRASNRGLGIQNRDEGTVTNVTFQNMQVECRLFSDVWWGKAEPIYVTSYPRAVGNHKDAGWRFPRGAKEGRCGEVSYITFRNITGLSENGNFLGADVPGKVHHITFDNVNIQPQRVTSYPQGVYDRRPCLGEGFLQGEPAGTKLDNVEPPTPSKP